MNKDGQLIGADDPLWLEALDRLPRPLRDPYYRPEYAVADGARRGDEPKLFYYRDGNFIFLYPILFRRLTHVAGRRLDEPIIDIESPYGHSGPLATTTGDSFLHRAQKSLLEHLSYHEITAEFIRFHPVLKTHQFASADVDVIFNRDMYSLDIPHNGDVLQAFPAKARNMIRRAHSLNIETRMQNLDSSNLSHFAVEYRSAMKTIGADEEYMFSDFYFDRLLQMGSGRLIMLSAHFRQTPLAYALFLLGPAGMHYHLSARTETKTIPGTINAVLHRAATEAQQHKIGLLHLGGGATPSTNDSLRRFKQSMASDTLRSYIGMRILDRDRYQYARSTWLRHGSTPHKNVRFLGYHDG